jgi:hypothetical protein
MGQYRICALLWWPFWRWQPVEIFQCRESIRDIIIYPHIKFWWYRTMLNFYPPLDYDVPNWFLISKNFYRSPFSKWPPQYRTNSTLSDFNDISYVDRLWCPRDIIIYPHIKFWWYRTMLNFYPPFLCHVLAAILKMADILKILKHRIAPLMVTYHYVKLWCPELIPDIEKFLWVAIFKIATTIPHKFNIVRFQRNFNLPTGFYSNPHLLWTPKNMTLTPFTTNVKTLGSTRNIYICG